MPELRVECRAAEGGRVPVRFGWPGAMREVTAVEDRWPGAGHCYYRVRTSDGGVYVLRHDERQDAWRIHSFARDGGDAQE